VLIIEAERSILVSRCRRSRWWIVVVVRLSGVGEAEPFALGSAVWLLRVESAAERTEPQNWGTKVEGEIVGLGR
jgi:hypothetical protein